MAAERKDKSVFDGEFKDDHGIIYRFRHHEGKRRCDVLFKVPPMEGPGVYITKHVVEFSQIFKDEASSTSKQLHYKNGFSRWIWKFEEDEIIRYSADDTNKIVTRKVLCRVKQSELTDKEVKMLQAYAKIMDCRADVDPEYCSVDHVDQDQIIMEYQKGWKKGHKSGFDQGYRKGWKRGDRKGWERGHKSGYDEGYQKGYDKAMNVLLNDIRSTTAKLNAAQEQMGQIQKKIHSVLGKRKR